MNTNKFKSNPQNYSDLINIDDLEINTRKPKSNVNSINSRTSWNWNEYAISANLISPNNIYFTIRNNTTLQTWEKNIYENDLANGKFPLSVDKFYVILTKTFELEPNYTFEFESEKNKLIVNFLAVLDGFFELDQTIILDEVIITGDKVLTLKLTQIETNYQNKIKELENKIYQLTNTPIIFAVNVNNFTSSKPDDYNPQFLSCRPDSTEFDLTIGADYEWFGNYMDFNKLTELENITLNNNQLRYWKNARDIGWNNQTSIRPHSNYLYNHVEGYNNYCNFLQYIPNIFDSPYIYLPSVKSLNIYYKSNEAFPTNTFKSVPNLSRLSFYDWANTEINSYELIKNIRKLNQLDYLNCSNIKDIDQIKVWCGSKNIKLEIR